MENMVLVDGEGKRGSGVSGQTARPPFTTHPLPRLVIPHPSAVAMQVSFQSWLKHSKTKSPGRRPFVDYQGVWVCGETASVCEPKMSSCKASTHLHGACNMYVCV